MKSTSSQSTEKRLFFFGIISSNEPLQRTALQTLRDFASRSFRYPREEVERFQEKNYDVVNSLYERAKAFYISMRGHLRVWSGENIDDDDSDGFYQEHVNQYLLGYLREARKIFKQIYQVFANDPINL